MTSRVPGRKLKPHPLPPRCTKILPMPPGVRIGQDSGGTLRHEFERRDGSWAPCSGRRTCPECIREQQSKTTLERVQEAVEIHCAKPVSAAVSREDEIEVLIAIEDEFQITLPWDGLDGRSDIEIATWIDRGQDSQK